MTSLIRFAVLLIAMTMFSVAGAVVGLDAGEGTPNEYAYLGTGVVVGSLLGTVLFAVVRVLAHRR